MLLLHIVDCSAEGRGQHIEEVRDVLERIGVGATPMIEVFNKIDLVDGATPHVERGEDGQIKRVWVSAHNREGLHLLLESIAERLNEAKVHKRIVLPPQAARLRAKLYSFGAIVDETPLETGGWALEITLAAARWDTLLDKIAPELREVDLLEGNGAVKIDTLPVAGATV